MPRLKKAEKDWLKKNHPGLLVIEKPAYTVIEGVFSFNATYNKKPLSDKYKIRINVPIENTPPFIIEIGERFKKIQKQKSLKPVDLHIYGNGQLKGTERLCLVAPQELRLKYQAVPNIKNYFRKYVEPYFYSQAHYEKYGEWPWEHLPHDATGMLEWFINNHELKGAAKETALEILKQANQYEHPKAINIVNRAKRREGFSPNSKCLCGSGKKYNQCGKGHTALTKLTLAIRQTSSQ
jgi:hypothetical protein